LGFYNFSVGAEIGIILGSKSDLPRVEEPLGILKNLGVDTILRVASAHRDLPLLEKTVREMESLGIEVFVTLAGLSAALPGIVASLTEKPVIGVPLDVGPLKGVDALLSMVQMPKGVPVATVGIGSSGVHNAFLLAMRVLSVKDTKYRNLIEKYQKTLWGKSDKKEG
jgi:phosphoribosylaminoimidazole carboxylase PurE protein